MPSPTPPLNAASTPSPLVSIAGWGPERQLVADADADTGVLLLAEYPIAFAQTHPGEDEIGPWLLLETILSTGEMFERVSAQDLKLTKWPLSQEDTERLGHLARKYGRNPKKLAQLYHRVAANNLRYAQAGTIGFGIWPVVSRANHSCAPNARVCATPLHPLAELLLATRPITRGEPVCWNYLGDDAFLQKDWLQRNATLHRHFQFLCRCPRCESERPPQFTGVPTAAMVDFLRRSPAQI